MTKHIRQEKVFVTSSLLLAALARSPWVSDEWQKEAEKFFKRFDEAGEISVEVAVEDSDMPIHECAKLMQGCDEYGFYAVKDAIRNAIDARPQEDGERDDIETCEETITLRGQK